MTKLRVAHILEAGIGGTRTHLDLIARHTDRARFELAFFCSTRRDPDFEADLAGYERAGIAVQVVDMRRAIRPLRDACSFWRIYRSLKRGRFHLVHTHSSKAGILGRLAARCAGVRIVVHTPHVFAFEQTSNPIAARLLISVERFAARLTDMLICVSQSERRVALNAGVAPEPKVRTVANAVQLPPRVDPNEIASLKRSLNIAPGAPVVGTVAHFRKQKGLDDFVEAASQIRRDHPAAVFVIVGKGDRSLLDRAIRARGLTGNFRIFAGANPPWPAYALMDVFVLSSLWEGMSYALLEAMAMGKAVVATSVGGSAEAVEHGVSGLLTAPRNPGNLAQAVSLLLEDHSRRLSFGSAARQRVAAEYCIESRIQELEAVYNSLCLQPTSHYMHSARQ